MTKGAKTAREKLWTCTSIKFYRPQGLALIYTHQRNRYVRPGTTRRSVSDDEGKKAAVDEIVARIKQRLGVVV